MRLMNKLTDYFEDEMTRYFYTQFFLASMALLSFSFIIAWGVRTIYMDAILWAALMVTCILYVIFSFLTIRHDAAHE